MLLQYIYETQRSIAQAQLYCRYNPNKRPSAAEVLSMPYFCEEPRCADDRTMADFMLMCCPE